MDDDLGSFRRLVGEPDAAGDLARAALAVARIEYPDLDPASELARLDALAARSGARDVRRPAERLERLRRFFFEEEGFHGNAADYYDPRNSCLNDVLDRRLGIPITLSVLVMDVGRRVGLAIAGLGLPGHFIVRAEIDGRGVLLDPFHGGTLLSAVTAAEVSARAVGRPVTLEEAHWTPCTTRQILVRMLRNLKGIYARRDEWDKALAVVDRLLVVEPDSPVHLRDRGTVLVRAGRLHAGAAEWERYLERYPHARDAEGFRRELRRIRQDLGSRN